ncbi:MAG: glycosyltransferase family 39 protein [Planctomycetota bacterium]
MALVRLLLAGNLGLGVDEAHYALYGIKPDLSYFDHPPLVGWILALSLKGLGVGAAAVRIPAILAGVGAGVLLAHWVMRLSQDRRTATPAVVALVASPLFSVLFLMPVPDTFLCLLTVPILEAALRVEARGRKVDWACLGLWLGLAGLTKYTAFLFPIAIGGFLLLRGRMDRLRGVGVWLGVAVGLMLISPVLYWNAKHDWISFAYQSKHVGGSSGLRAGKFLQSLAAQFGAYSPLLLPIGWFGLIRLWRQRGEPRALLTFLVTALILAFFAAGSLRARALPHWTAPAYFLLIPIGTVELLRASRPWRKVAVVSVGLSGALVLLLHAELARPFLPFPAYQSLHRDLRGFEHAVQVAVQEARGSGAQGLAVPHWTLASRASFYALGSGFPVYVLDDRFDQFDLWAPDPPANGDLIVLSTHDQPAEWPGGTPFQATEAVASWEEILNGKPVQSYRIDRGHGFHGVEP